MSEVTRDKPKKRRGHGSAARSLMASVFRYQLNIRLESGDAPDRGWKGEGMNLSFFLEIRGQRSNEMNSGNGAWIERGKVHQKERDLFLRGGPKAGVGKRKERVIKGGRREDKKAGRRIITKPNGDQTSR